MIRSIFPILAGLLCLPLFAQQPILRTPALSPSGSSLAFSYQGDIWTVPANGGVARRLTIHESYDVSPQWSPDGQHIAFVSNRYDNFDVMVTTPAGATPQRLTYHSASDVSPRWLSNTDLVFSTRRLFAQVERESEFYQASLNGGTPIRMLDEVGSQLTPSPDGRYYAFVRGGCRVSREAYRGPANRDIWVYDTQQDTYTQITDDEGQDYFPAWSSDGQLYFLSAREGRYNLYRTNPTASAQPERLTNFTEWGIRNYSLAGTGNQIVIEIADRLEASTDGGKTFQSLNIQVGTDFRFYPTEERELTSGLQEFALSPDEKFLVMGTHGELLVKPNDKEKSRSINASEHPYRDEEAAWLNDSVLLFISDRAGLPTLHLCQSKTGQNGKLYLSFERDIKQLQGSDLGVSDFVLSPDRDKIAIIEGRGRLLVYDIDSTAQMSNRKVLLDGWDYPGGLSWSPDGQWLAYNLSDLNFNEEVYIHPADNSSAAVNVSMHPRGDYSPFWSRDGRKLGFLSIRNNGNSDVWFAWLRKADYERTQEDWEESADWESDTPEDTTGTVVIDFDGLHERLEQVTSLPGNEGDVVIGPEGEFFYFTTNNGSRAGSEGDSDLMKVRWDGKEMSVLLADVSINDAQLSKDGKTLYMLQRGKVTSTGLDKGSAESQSFSGSMHINHVEERKQLIEDGWRALEAGFYDPEFHGRDWNALKEKYTPLMLGASTRQGFSLFYNEMLGQLNASHMGFRSPVTDEDLQEVETGQIGVEFDADGRISYILPESPAARSESRLEIGDRILAINGKSIAATDNLYHFLNGTAGQRIQLTIDRNGATEKLILRPTSSLTNQRYEAWVQWQKELTKRYSNDRLGYIHIRGMNWSSFERFERELTAAGLGKDGIVIDVRYNGGGWTTDMLMAVLNVRQHAYTIPRGAATSLGQHQDFLGNYPFGERLPLAALTKPSVALCNEASYSNAEIFSHAYKHLGHGTLVGQPTFGAVISTGAHRMMDGSYVRMPFRAWYVHATQENMEGGPAVPDIIVANAPGSKAADEDAQLKAAVDDLLTRLK